MPPTAPVLRNSPQSYGAVAKTFHWLTALLILTVFPLGLAAQNWPYDTSEALATKAILFSIHKTLGITVFFVGLLRILWAVSQPKPGLLHPDRKLESWVAETVHWLLYTAMVVVPLSGWITHAATSGYAPILWPFGQHLPFVPISDGIAHLFGGIHFMAPWVLAAAFVLHFAGALKHHVIDRDLTLTRMLPGQTLAGAPRTGHARSPMWAAFAVYAAAIGVGAVLGLSAPAQAPGAPSAALAKPLSGWTVDSGSLNIAVTQLGSKVPGSFANWTAAINFDPNAGDVVKGDVTVEIAIDSLTLGTVTAEALKPEFFDATSQPTARYTAEIWEDPQGPGAYLAVGNLTLKGADVPVEMPFTLEINGKTATMSGTTTLDRRDFSIGTSRYADEKTIAFPVEITVTLTATRNE